MSENKYAGTQTEKNLQAAFAGESQARNKYTYFASVAKKEGMEQISALFLKTADNEKEHAKLWFKELGGIFVCAFNGSKLRDRRLDDETDNAPIACKICTLLNKVQAERIVHLPGARAKVGATAAMDFNNIAALQNGNSFPDRASPSVQYLDELKFRRDLIAGLESIFLHPIDQIIRNLV